MLTKTEIDVLKSLIYQYDQPGVRWAINGVWDYDLIKKLNRMAEISDQERRQHGRNN